MESLEVKKYYEWKATSRVGKVEVYLAETETQIYFQSGRFVEKDQLDQMMIEVDEARYHQKGGDNQFAPPPPPQQPQSIEEWEKILGNPEPNSIAPPAPRIEKEKSAVQIILEKQKKLKETHISLNIPIKIPNDKAIEFMTVMFEEDEVIDEISNFIKSQITEEKIIEIIKDSLKSKISNYSDSKEE